MEKTTVKKLGKTISSFAIIIAGAGTFLLTFAGGMVPGDVKDIIYGIAITLVAIGAYLAHKNMEV